MKKLALVFFLTLMAFLSGCVGTKTTHTSTTTLMSQSTTTSVTKSMPTHSQIVEALNHVKNYSFNETISFFSINTTVIVRGVVAGKNASAIIVTNTSLPNGVIESSKTVFFISGNFYAILSDKKPLIGCGNISRTGLVFPFEVDPWKYILNASRDRKFKVERLGKGYLLKYRELNLTVSLDPRLVPKEAVLEFMLSSGRVVLKIRLDRINDVRRVSIPPALTSLIPKVPSKVCGDK